MSVSIMRDTEGKPIGFVGINRDITERKRAEEALKERERFHRGLLNDMVSFVAVLKPDGEVIFVNNTPLKVGGLGLEDVVGKMFYDCDWWTHSDEVHQTVKECIEQCACGETLIQDIQIQTADGSLMWIEYSMHPYFDENGSVKYLIPEGRDITKRKQVEKLQESLYSISQAVDSSESLDDLYKAVHEIIQDVMTADNFYIAIYDDKEDMMSFPYFVDEKGVKAQPRKFGRGITEYVIRTGESLLCNKEDQEELENRGEIKIFGGSSEIWLGVPLKVEGKTTGVMALQHYTDSKVYGEREKAILEFVSGQVAKAIEHKRAEEALKDSETKYRQLAETAKDVIMVLDLEGKIKYINQEGLRLSGYSEGEAMKMKITDVLTDDQVPGAVERFTKRAAGVTDLFTYDIEFTNKAGDRIPFEVKSSLITERSEPSGVLIIARDVAERKHLEEQFRQAQKMESVGRLAGGIAHDFNNLLTIIVGRADLALAMVDPNDPVWRNLDEIQNTTQRAANLTRQLLAFSRRQTLQPKILNLNGIITELEKMLKLIISEDINLMIYLGPDLWLVKVDPGQAEQVIINLAINARDAMPAGGRLEMATMNVELDEEYARTHPDVTPGPHVMLAISDTGCGMTDEVKSKIFEPFFTTKEEGKGTGLGLSTVYGIVKQSGGNIWVYSELDKGTTVKIYLPMVEGKAEEFKRKVVDISEAPRGTETILVVEDEEPLRELTCWVLEQQGYNVLEAQTGGDAYLLCQKMEKPVDLVLTDVVMPNIGGPEFVDKLKEIWFIRLMRT